MNEFDTAYLLCWHSKFTMLEEVTDQRVPTLVIILFLTYLIQKGDSAPIKGHQDAV